MEDPPDGRRGPSSFTWNVASPRPPFAWLWPSRRPRRYTRSRPNRRPRRVPITYSSLLLAILTGIVQAGLAPELVIGGVKPNLVLTAVVLVTSTFGFSAGIAWAFVAGLVANLLTSAPLGSVPLALLAVAVMVSAGARLLGRLVWLYPILAAFAGSILADLVVTAALVLVAGSVVNAIPVQIIVATAVLNAAITGVLLVPTRILVQRYRLEERPVW